MKLDIIVPHYQEPWSVCHWLMDSIAMQQGIDMKDIRVIHAQDGHDGILPFDIFKDYPFKVMHIVKGRGGVSEARNFGLDHAKADYVMFCDADDMFLSNYGLHMVFAAMQEGFDVLVSAFVEEMKDQNGNFQLQLHRTNDATFVHGKVFRRQFLIDNGIRFKPELRIHEDGYFNCLARTVGADHTKTIETPFYLWKWNDNSVVRSDNDHFLLRTYDHLMKMRYATCSELYRRGLTEAAELFNIQTVVDAYYDSNKTEWLEPKNAELVKKAEMAFKTYYLRFRKEYNASDINKVANSMKLTRPRAVDNGMRVEQRTLPQWLNHIMKDVEPTGNGASVLRK